MTTHVFPFDGRAPGALPLPSPPQRPVQRSRSNGESTSGEHKPLVGAEPETCTAEFGRPDGSNGLGHAEGIVDVSYDVEALSAVAGQLPGSVENVFSELARALQNEQQQREESEAIAAKRYEEIVAELQQERALREAAEAELHSSVHQSEQTMFRLVADLEKKVEDLQFQVERESKELRHEQSSREVLATELQGCRVAMEARAAEQEAQQRASFEARLAQKYGVLEVMIQQVEQTIQKMDQSNALTVGHLQTVIDSVASIQRDAAVRGADCQELQKAVLDLQVGRASAVRETITEAAGNAERQSPVTRLTEPSCSAVLRARSSASCSPRDSACASSPEMRTPALSVDRSTGAIVMVIPGASSYAPSNAPSISPNDDYAQISCLKVQDKVLQLPIVDADVPKRTPGSPSGGATEHGTLKLETVEAMLTSALAVAKQMPSSLIPVECELVAPVDSEPVFVSAQPDLPSSGACLRRPWSTGPKRAKSEPNLARRPDDPTIALHGRTPSSCRTPRLTQIPRVVDATLQPLPPPRTPRTAGQDSAAGSVPASPASLVPALAAVHCVRASPAAASHGQIHHPEHMLRRSSSGAGIVQMPTSSTPVAPFLQPFSPQVPFGPAAIPNAAMAHARETSPAFLRDPGSSRMPVSLAQHAGLGRPLSRSLAAPPADCSRAPVLFPDLQRQLGLTVSQRNR